MNERALIRTLGRLLPGHRSVITGIGDDAAVVRNPSDKLFDLVLTSDPVIEGVHFTADAPAPAIGHKAVARSLSDLAAMGAEPLWALVDLVAAARTPASRLKAIYRGLAATAHKHGLTVVGGDTAGGPRLELHVFAVGRVPRGRAILRSGARPGDVIFVTGMLGGSISGRHLSFAPRVVEGSWLRAEGWATAMIDLSDGLASDLRRLTEMSRTGAVIDSAAVPVSKAALRNKDGCPAIAHALADGEDYELLFTVAPRKAAGFQRAWRKSFSLRISRVGVMTDERGLVECLDVNGKRSELADGGYEHFFGDNRKS